MTLSEDQIRAIATEVAIATFGAPNIVSLSISAGPDWSGDPSYFLDFTIGQPSDRDIAMFKRLSLRRDVRDRLVTEGDETYPYVRILNPVVAAVGD